MKKMQKIFCIVCMAGALTFASSTYLLPQQVEAAEAQATVSTLLVEGEGAGEVKPDRATISIGVVSEATDAKEAQRQNAEKAANIQKALLGAGIEANDMQTSGYAFYPVYRDETVGNSRQSSISGYRADNTVTVVVRDVKNVGAIIDTALASGANTINSLNFGAKDQSAVRKQAMEAAVRDARDKANVLAAALGRRIVGIKSVSESSSDLMERNTVGARFMMAANSTPKTPIAEGSLTMTANVRIEYILSE